MHLGDYTGQAIASGTVVTGSTSSQLLLGRDDNRLGLMIYNHANGALFLKLGNGATVTNFTVKLSSGSYYELPRPIHTGSITMIGDAAGGHIMATTMFKL